MSDNLRLKMLKNRNNKVDVTMLTFKICELCKGGMLFNDQIELGICDSCESKLAIKYENDFKDVNRKEFKDYVEAEIVANTLKGSTVD